MKPLGVLHAGFIILAGLILCATTLVQAMHGRDFAGFYELSNVTDLGEEVGVTLSVRVFNYSDEDVSDATITLEDSLLPDTTYYGSFIDVYVNDRESVRLQSDVTIPWREYEHWQNGGTPSLWIDFTDTAGNPVERMIELAPMIVGE